LGAFPGFLGTRHGPRPNARSRTPRPPNRSAKDREVAGGDDGPPCSKQDLVNHVGCDQLPPHLKPWQVGRLARPKARKVRVRLCPTQDRPRSDPRIRGFHHGPSAGDCRVQTQGDSGSSEEARQGRYISTEQFDACDDVVGSVNHLKPGIARSIDTRHPGAVVLKPIVWLHSPAKAGFRRVFVSCFEVRRSVLDMNIGSFQRSQDRRDILRYLSFGHASPILLAEPRPACFIFLFQRILKTLAWLLVPSTADPN
jgi:hypothetical protein